MGSPNEVGGAYDVGHSLCLLDRQQAQGEASPRRDAGALATESVEERMKYDGGEICLSLSAAGGEVDDVHYLAVCGVRAGRIGEGGHPGNLCHQEYDLEEAPGSLRFRRIG